MSDWYQTNFIKGKVGNMLPYGEKHLIVRIKEAMWVTGILFAKQKDHSWKVIQLEQTGSKSNPWEDTIVFEMFMHGRPFIKAAMSTGDYKIRIRAQRGVAGVVGLEDEFYIA